MISKLISLILLKWNINQAFKNSTIKFIMFFYFNSSYRLLITVILIGFLTLKTQGNTEIKWKQINNISIPLPPPEHPRLYINPDQAAQLKERIDSPVLKPVVDKLKKQSSESLQLKLEWDAIQYMLSKDKILGRKIIDSTLTLLKRTELPDIGDAARYTGRMMVTGAMVYDWLYPLLTISEKKEFIGEFVRLAKTLECGYPPTQQGSVTGHSSESFVMRDLLSAGIALYDEYPEMYELAAERFFRDHLPVRNWIYNGHAYHQGDSYGPLRYSWDTYPLMIFDRMGVKNVYNKEQRFVPYYYTYTTRPDGQRMRSGDTFLHSNHGAPPGKPWEQYVGTLFTASYYQDGYLLEQFLRQGAGNEKAHGRTLQYEKIFEFLWWDIELEPKPIHSLPYSRYFGPPFGWMVSRTGWDKNSVVAEMNINVYNFSNHQHLDAGAFQIYYRGPLATESGLYAGTSGAYGSAHCKNYYWRTIAHNSLLIYDPQEQFHPAGDFGNDGGQRLPNNRWEPKNLEDMLNPEKGYQTGEVLAHFIGPDKIQPDFSYLKGDITKAYSSKAKEVKRSFVFLNLKNEQVPAALIVYDKIISTSPAFKKYWLIHSIEEPEIQSNEIIITKTGNGDYGKLVCTGILPKNLDLNAVGGPGREFWVFGKNYENEMRAGTAEHTYERAAWRVEISPGTPSLTDYFLNVMQVMDLNEQKIDVNTITGDKVTGVNISDRIVLFSKNYELIDSSITFSVEKKNSYKILMTDLKPGEWQIQKDKKPLKRNIQVTEEEGILYFEGTNGTYEIKRL